jgi:hypothetical protein
MLLAVGLAACASGPPPAPPLPEWDESRSETAARLEQRLADATAPADVGLELRLAFEGLADLDLYVTDPGLETLYYANNPVRSGGELLEDQRCDGEGGAGPRIEVARFALPPPGRYRVGVDFPASCGRDVDVVPFALRIESPAGVLTRRGLAERLRFDPIVVEFDVP